MNRTPEPDVLHAPVVAAPAGEKLTLQVRVDGDWHLASLSLVTRQAGAGDDA